MKLYPLRRTPLLVNATNFQLDPSVVLAPCDIEVGGRGPPLTLHTIPTTGSTNVLLVMEQRHALCRTYAKMHKFNVSNGRQVVIYCIAMQPFRHRAVFVQLQTHRHAVI